MGENLIKFSLIFIRISNNMQVVNNTGISFHFGRRMGAQGRFIIREECRSEELSESFQGVA